MKPVGSKLKDRFDERMADKAAGALPWLFGEAKDDASTTDTAGELPAPAPADIEIAEQRENSPDAGEVLQRELETKLSVSLPAGAAHGTPQWYLLAYEAVLWRVAVLAAWEERPIAIAGALQGEGWLTVCVPGWDVRGGIVAPNEMWRREDQLRLRRLHDDQPVEFFVRKFEDPDERDSEASRLNEQLMMDPSGFKPKAGETVAASWHRIDGFGRKWVVLHPDAKLEKAIHESRSPKWEGSLLFRQNLELRPPKPDEYGDEWRPLIIIKNEAAGIAAVSDGADRFAKDSQAAAAAQKALERDD